MSQNEIASKVQELQELRRMREELAAEIESVQDEIKSYMMASGTDQFTVGAWHVSYKAVASSRLDTTALRKALPEIAQQYTQTTTTRRFTVQ